MRRYCKGKKASAEILKMFGSKDGRSLTARFCGAECQNSARHQDPAAADAEQRPAQRGPQDPEVEPCFSREDEAGEVGDEAIPYFS